VGRSNATAERTKRRRPPSRTASNETAGAIARRLKAQRTRLGLTLREVAERSGLSTPFISQAERGHTVPSLVSLNHLARALEVSVDYFIDVPTAAEIVRRRSEPVFIQTGSPVTYRRLSASLPAQQMDALLMTLPPGVDPTPARREGEGFYYILSGRVRFTVGGETFVVGKGDSVHFDQRSPYNTVVVGRQPAVMLWVGTPPLFASGRDGALGGSTLNGSPPAN
jgi:transcriptional regulator with XRE-family HTH domain